MINGSIVEEVIENVGELFHPLITLIKCFKRLLSYTYLINKMRTMNPDTFFVSQFDKETKNNVIVSLPWLVGKKKNLIVPNLKWQNKATHYFTRYSFKSNWSFKIKSKCSFYGDEFHLSDFWNTIFLYRQKLAHLI